jgi:transketolase
MTPDVAPYARILVEAGTAHPKLVVVDAGLATSMQTAAFRAAFPERYVNLGIAEANAVGFASGLARRGFHPVVHSFANFLARRAHDQIAVSVALPGLPVTLVGGSCSVFDGKNGPSHFAGDDLATFTTLPGFSVFEPADAVDLAAVLTAAADRPAYLRLRRYGMPVSIGAHPTARAPVRLVHDGGPDAVATIVAIGAMLDETLTACRILDDDGFAVDLFHILRIKPLDADLILASAHRTRCVVAVENHVAVGGGASLVEARVAPLGIRFCSLSLPDEFQPAGDPNWLLARCGLDATSLAERIADFLTQESASCIAT